MTVSKFENEPLVAVNMHIVKSYAPNDCNRTESGMPNTAVYNGVIRRRMSSLSLNNNVKNSDCFKELSRGVEELIPTDSQETPLSLASALFGDMNAHGALEVSDAIGTHEVVFTVDTFFEPDTVPGTMDDEIVTNDIQFNFLSADTMYYHLHLDVNMLNDMYGEWRGDKDIVDADFVCDLMDLYVHAQPEDLTWHPIPGAICIELQYGKADETDYSRAFATGIAASKDRNSEELSIKALAKQLDHENASNSAEENTYRIWYVNPSYGDYAPACADAVFTSYREAVKRIQEVINH